MDGIPTPYTHSNGRDDFGVLPELRGVLRRSTSDAVDLSFLGGGWYATSN